ncbi:hypothetical protein BCR33DRAFT_579918 [Rhizoclosmatium globosum]|uniref:Uncharacterized protein n=1 Tax=Rhizoclosmatium globosum TaxID=329046 RepID=A0A1Y2CQS5_9FUNG|nr:hypothetical protein BCR33DRAFT_579918 [Rhizoclosmatium globosum]|eukprot:ORY49323.1 hypothetical protein BCR33DRAFT_579918 [Rhizoclosmatium globosum]
MNLESQLEETKLELINVQASLQHQSTAFQQSEDASYLLKSQSQEAQLQLKHFQSPLSNDEPRSYHDDGDIHVGPLNLPDNLKVHHLFNEKEKENTLMKHEFEQLKKAFEEVQHQKMELEMDFNQEQLLKNKLLLKNNDLTKELQRVNATSEAATERLNTELNKFRVTLSEKEQGTLQLEEKLEVLQRISEKQSASIQAEKEEVIHSLNQKLEEIKQLREDLLRAQNIASKYNSLKGQLSCLTSSSQDMTSRDGHLVESTETLADDLPSNLNSQVQEVVMKLTTLEQVVATDASKLIGFMQNLSSNEFVEQEIKDIFKAVFGSQVQNQFETKSTLSLFRKALIDSLPTLEKQLTASIKVSDNNIEERLKILQQRTWILRSSWSCQKNST